MSTQAAHSPTMATPAGGATPPAPNEQPTPISQPPPPQTLTLRAKLNAGEQHWVWKYSLRLILLVIGIIGIGCASYITSTSSRGPYAFHDKFYAVWTLIPFTASLIWCTVTILIFLLRHSHSGVHPGAIVGIDLILWLAYIPTSLLMLLGAVNVLEWGRGGTIGQYTPYGYYHQVSNGTWIWNATEYDTYYGRERDCSADGSSYSYGGYVDYGFDSCEEEDAFINALWTSKPQRVGISMTASVCQFLALLLHLVLFIWACVDTHRRNRKKSSKEAEKLAANIVMNMVRNGAIVTDASVSHQPGLYQQLRDPAHQGAPMQQGHVMQQRPVMQPGWNAVPQGMMSREKVDGPARFA